MRKFENVFPELPVVDCVVVEPELSLLLPPHALASSARAATSAIAPGQNTLRRCTVNTSPVGAIRHSARGWAFPAAAIFAQHLLRRLRLVQVNRVNKSVNRINTNA